jgi:hypothetical protein
MLKLTALSLFGGQLTSHVRLVGDPAGLNLGNCMRGHWSSVVEPADEADYCLNEHLGFNHLISSIFRCDDGHRCGLQVVKNRVFERMSG